MDAAGRQPDQLKPYFRPILDLTGPGFIGHIGAILELS